MYDFTESELVDLEIKYKNNEEVLRLIEFVKQSLMTPSGFIRESDD